MAKTVFDVLLEKINGQILLSQEFLSVGSAKDYANYREVVGLIRGLETSKSFIEDLLRNYMDEEDDN
jgi:hypothetical protein